MNITVIAEQIPLGGEALRFDTGPRSLTLPYHSKFDPIVNFPDLSVGITKTLWSAATAALTNPKELFILVDPENTYADNLTEPPTLTVAVTRADDIAGTNAAVVAVFDVRRECPLLLPGLMRAAVDTSTANRVLYAVTARNNHASGYGSINARCLVVA